jgi:hypothetical protein
MAIENMGVLSFLRKADRLIFVKQVAENPLGTRNSDEGVPKNRIVDYAVAGLAVSRHIFIIPRRRARCTPRNKPDCSPITV